MTVNERRSMRRDKLDVLRDILSVCSEEKVLITHIIYRSNTNSSIASRYVNWMITHDFLAKKSCVE